jgi:hypothetical protein
MVHGLGNDAIGFSGLATNHQALTPHHQITKAVPILLLGALVIGIAGRQLGRELDLEPAAAGGGEVL